MRTILAISLCCLLAGAARAQVPNISVYHDSGYTQTNTVCPGQIFDTLYVVANNFNSYVQAISYQVNYPSSMSWLGDFHDAPLAVGNSSDGIALAYQIPQASFGQWLIQRVLFFWNCTNCGDVQYFPPYPSNRSIFVDGYLANPLPQWVTPAGEEREALGLWTYICEVFPTEEHSWGVIKSKYR